MCVLLLGLGSGNMITPSIGGPLEGLTIAGDSPEGLTVAADLSEGATPGNDNVAMGLRGLADGSYEKK